MSLTHTNALLEATDVARCRGSDEFTVFAGHYAQMFDLVQSNDVDPPQAFTYALEFVQLYGAAILRACQVSGGG